MQRTEAAHEYFHADWTQPIIQPLRDSVGAGLLANQFKHPPSPWLTRRLRQQAGSYS
jgi:hypothetical protein